MADLDMILEVVQDIKDQMDDVDSKCDKLLEFRAVHIESHKTLDSSITAFKKTLYGNDNGTGLTYKVEKLLQCKQNFISNADRWRGFWISILRTIVTAAIIGLAVWLLSVYRQQPGTAGQAFSQEKASSLSID